MNGDFLLDTNIVIALFANEPSVLEKLATAERVFVASIVLGELFFGARRARRVEENLTRVEEFAASNAVLTCDTTTARYYGNIKNMLQGKGRPLPENDIWIAAIAQQHGLILVSRDAHFNEIENLEIETWDL